MSDVLLNKLGAAERQIHAAIDMFEADLDPLATFVVAASARKLLSELKAKRGGEHTADLLRWSLFYMARDLRLGRLAQEEVDRTGLADVIADIVGAMVAGSIETVDDLHVVKDFSDRAYWAEQNRPFNSLKHADRDHSAFLNIATVDAERTIVEAGALFKQLTGRATSKMARFAIGPFI